MAIPSISFRLNYFTGLNSIAGTLTLEMEKAVFKAGTFNFGDTSDKTIPIVNICGYKKGILAILYVFLDNGHEIKLATWDKDRLIAAFEERRQAIYTNQGKPVPPLTRF